MQLRNTLIFIPEGETEVVKVEIYVSSENVDPGLWNIDDNKVLLSDRLYSHYRDCKTQKEQRKFFSNLKKVSNCLLGI